MPKERRDRQNLNLDTGTLTVPCSGVTEHKETASHKEQFPNRWFRIGYTTRMQICKIPNQVLKSPVLEIRMRGSARVLPSVIRDRR